MDEREDADDTTLVRAALADADAFEGLVVRYQHLLRGFVACQIQQADLTEEIVQETFVRAYVGLRRWREGEPFSAWLHGIARHVIRDHFRRRGRQRQRQTELRLHLQARLAERQEEVASTAAMEALEVCVDGLEPGHRELVRRRYLDGAAVQDLARSVGRKPTAVSMLLLRLRRSLLECIQRRLAVR